MDYTLYGVPKRQPRVKQIKKLKKMGETLIEVAMDLRHITTKKEHYDLLENAVKHLRLAKEMEKK